ncbi:MAG: hypothetical protein K2X41_09205 [Hyphomicrobium sp.]|nr:hypothetical protein [Hyphomicrobium sp.]
MLALLPIAVAVMTAGLATLTGCDVSEIGPEVCTVLGVDIGGTLSGLLAGGWLGLVTIPFVMIAAALWLLVESLALFGRRRKARRLARRTERA